MSIGELLEAAKKVVVDEKEIEALQARLQAAEEKNEEENLARSANQDFMAKMYCL